MSHQSGIQASDDLAALLPRAKDSETARFIKISIKEEVMHVGGTLDAEGSFEDDYDKCVLNMIDTEECCYMLVKMDSKNSMGYNWVFISYSPDYAHVRDKMLYASTRSTLKTTFNPEYVKYEMFGTVPDDVSFAGFKKHVESEEAPAPLTMEEHEKAEIRSMETGADIGASTKRAMVATGVSFPPTEDAVNALQALKDGDIDFVQLALDVEDETTVLTAADSSSVSEAMAKLPGDIARYNVIRYKHNHEGDTLDSIMFVYSCPSYEMAVRDRMLYASCKGPILEIIEQQLTVPIAKKMEIQEASEFTEESFYQALHPVVQAFTKKFDRPKGPGNRRGQSRMTGRPRRTK